MTRGVLLSILIPTLEGRSVLFAELLHCLTEQIRRDGLQGRVEILSDLDDGALPIGTKRNRLMERATGRFLVFVDDDDEVCDDYVRTIISAVEHHPDVDVLGLLGEITFRGKHPRRFIMSTRFREYATRSGGYERPPHHLNPTRTEVARRYLFEEVSQREDSDRALRMARDQVLRGEHMIDSVLYYYRSRRWWPYQWVLDHTEWIRHPLGLQLVNYLRVKRWLREVLGARERAESALEPVREIVPPRGLPSLGLADLAKRLELIYLLTMRDLRVRYKQTIVRVSWALLQPLLTMAIFTFVFSRVAGFSSGRAPYAVYALCGIIPWTYFVHALTKTTSSLVDNHSLVEKVAFPRLVIPIASVVAALADFIVSLPLVFVAMAFYGVSPTWTSLALPICMIAIALTALAFGLWLSALNVLYRDVINILPFASQLWFFLTPIAYPVEIVPPQWRLLYTLNPITGIVNCFRWALLGPDYAPDASWI